MQGGLKAYGESKTVNEDNITMGYEGRRMGRLLVRQSSAELLAAG